nr:M48 family metalloprotease [Halorhodospira abdelmalekii]
MGVSTVVGFFRNSNGHDVARHFGGRLISAGDPSLSLKEQQALNIVDELSLAANHPPPALYVLPEPAINAFAAGRDREHAVVAVTEGALSHFDRDQLAGVIAHELAHVANEDIKINIRLAAFVMGFTVLFFAARMLFRSALYGRGNPRAKLVILVFAIALALIGSISVLSGRILQAMMSRQREYLADASAVQFTRHPKGIASALRVIRDGGRPTDIQHPEAAEHSHAFLFKVNNSIFDTHPPLEERIQRLENRRDYAAQAA